MVLKQKTDGCNVGGDIEFLMSDQEGETVSVTISREALEDYANPHGVAGDSHKLFLFALDKIVETANHVYEQDRRKPRKFFLRTQDLNRLGL